MKSNYEKRPIPVAEQINLLESKGMEFFDMPFASRTLSIIGYYRFSGYAYPFRNNIDNSSFVEDTSFEKVFSIYEFDRSLKSLLFSYLGRIEIAFRTLIIDKFSVGTSDALWYVNPANFTDKEEYGKFIDKIQENISESKEDFIKHFRENYADPFPPAWMALQIVSFGALVKLFSNFNNKELQGEVSKHFGCDNVERFISWMNTLVYLRNICSHHARLWNRAIKKVPEAFNFGIKTKRWTESDLTRLYYSVCVIGFLLKTLYPGNNLKKKLASLLASNTYVNSTKGKFLGFPNNWQTEFAWD